MYTRNCPYCNIELLYKLKSVYNTAIKKNSLCRKCACKTEEAQERKKRVYWSNLGLKDYSGENNPFFGKHQTLENKIKIGLINKNRIRSDDEINKLKENLITYGNRRNIYDIWKEKYSEEEYQSKVLARSKNISEKFSGENNPMYGKPSPNGSGNGWSGWYKNWFFRSLGELSYVINVLEANNTEWKSAENIKIPYVDWDGKTRNYFPDFITKDYLIECKPKKLHNTPKVQAKALAAIEYCKVIGVQYILEESPIFDECLLEQLIESGKVKLTDKYSAKYQKCIKK